MKIPLPESLEKIDEAICSLEEAKAKILQGWVDQHCPYKVGEMVPLTLSVKGKELLKEGLYKPYMRIVSIRFGYAEDGYGVYPGWDIDCALFYKNGKDECFVHASFDGIPGEKKELWKSKVKK